MFPEVSPAYKVINRTVYKQIIKKADEFADWSTVPQKNIVNDWLLFKEYMILFCKVFTSKFVYSLLDHNKSSWIFTVNFNCCTHQLYELTRNYKKKQETEVYVPRGTVK